MLDSREVQRQRLREELQARLARVRGPMTDAVFEDLINAVEETSERMAEIDRDFLTVVVTAVDEHEAVKTGRLTSALDS
jgi:hypothetical protein